MSWLGNLLSVVFASLFVVYIVTHYLNLYTLVSSIFFLLYVIYRVEKHPEDRLIARTRSILITGCDRGKYTRRLHFMHVHGTCTRERGLKGFRCY